MKPFTHISHAALHPKNAIIFSIILSLLCYSFPTVHAGQEDPMGPTCDAFFDDVIAEQLEPYKEHGISIDNMTAGAMYAEFGFKDTADIKVVDGEVYLKMHADGPRIVEYTAYWIKALLCRFKLPDMQLTIEASGFQYNELNALPGSPPAPLFAYNRHRAFSHYHILLPYQLVGGHRLELDDVPPAEPWEQRIPVAIWRGTTTGDYPVNTTTVMDLPRTRICMACKELGSHLCDSKYTSVVQTRNRHEAADVWDQLKTMELTGEFVTKAEMMKYKYVIIPDGNVAPTSRSINSFQTGALVMKPSSMWEEFWYRKVIPFYHFVPMPLSSQELNTTLQWLARHDDTARMIANNGRNFALKHLTKNALECYVGRLLHQYAGLLKFKPSIADNEREGFKPLEAWMRKDQIKSVSEITQCNNWKTPMAV